VADVPAPMVMGTLIGYLAIYAALLIGYVSVIVYLARKAARGDAGPQDMGRAPSPILTAAE